MFNTGIPEWRDLIRNSDHYVVSSGSPYINKQLICFKVKVISSVQLLSHIRLFATPWTAAYQAFLSITNFWGLLEPMPIER